MTITVAPARNELTANAGQTIFNYTFKIFSITDLNVYITPTGQEANDSTDLTTAYTVLGVGDEDGGTITLTTGAILNDLITIVSNTPSSRTTDYQNNGDFRPDTVNADFDRVVSLVKKIEDSSNRSLLSPQSKQGPKPLSLPNPIVGELLRWNDTLTGLENISLNELPVGAFPVDRLALNYSTLAAWQADTSAQLGDVVTTAERSTGNGGGATGQVIASGTEDGFSIVKHNTLPLSWKFRNDGSVSPAQMGAGRDNADYGPEIQAAWDYAFDNGISATGHGIHFTKVSTVLRANFSSFAGLIISSTDDFAGGIANDIEELGRRIIIVDKVNAIIHGLRGVNGGSTDNIVGLDLAQHQIKATHSGGADCRINTLVRSFSIVVKEGRNTRQQIETADAGVVVYNLLAYAPASNKEINSLTIDGGEYFGSNSVAIDIGDTLDLFTTTIAPGEFHGVGLRIVNQPTCDQGQLRVDRMLDCFVDVYSEGSGAVLTDKSALVLGGAFTNSVRGIEIIGYARDFDNFVECLGGVSGIEMHNTRSRSIKFSALRLTTDQFSYRYYSNFQTDSFTLGQEVHTGIRSGILTNAWAGKTIDVYDLYNGHQTVNGEHQYPDKQVVDGFRYEYSHNRYRYYQTPFVAACTVSGNAVTFNTASEVANYNGGDAVNFTGTGGALTYVLKVNYDAGTMTLDSFAFSGAGNIEQQTQVARVEYSSFQLNPSTAFKDSSVIWNIYTVDTTTIYWVLKSGAWSART